MRRVALALFIGVLLIAVVPASAGAVAVQTANGHRYGVFLRPGVGVSALPGAQVATSGPAAKGAKANGNLDYNGGQVLHSTAPYLIFWDPNGHISAHSRTVLDQYLADTAADSGKATDVYSVLRQYTDTTGFADYKQTFSASQAIVDAQPYPSVQSGCTTNGSSPNCITDGQLQTEVARLISTRSLPTGTGPNAPIYFLITPADTNICATGLGCASSGFCAYHSAFNDGGTNVVYSPVPFAVWTDNPSKGCQVDGHPDKYQSPNNDQADNIADDLSHELDESITDPLVGTGWVNNTGGNEVADNCESFGTDNPFNGTSLNAYEPALGGTESAGTLFNQAINGDHYYTQTDWSNGDVGCKTQTSADALAPRFVESAPSTAASFDPTSSTQSAGSISSVSWNFGDGSTAFSTSSLGPINHTYAAPGTYTVTLTLVDSFGNLATVSHSLTTGARPAASFTAPAFGVVGQAVTFDGSGSSYANGPIVGYAWSFGDGTTSAAGPATAHTYAAPGTYTVSLTVTGAGGLQSAISHQIVVNGPPTASFTAPKSALARAPVKFDAGGSSDPGGSIIGYSWSFGDGATSAAGPTASHAYSARGTYTVTLTVTDSNGLHSTASHQITVSKAQIGKVKVSGTTASVTVSCKGSTACSFTLQLSVTETKKGKKKTVVVGKVPVTLAGGKTKTIQIKLNATGRQLLTAQSGKLKTTLAIVSSGTAVSHTTVTFTG